MKFRSDEVFYEAQQEPSILHGLLNGNTKN